jgi:ABC-type transporter Mla subunit MlaD
VLGDAGIPGTLASVSFITIHIHQYGASAAELRAINRRLDTLMATDAENTATLNELVAKTTKIGDETRALLQKIADLTAIIEAGNTSSPEFDAALAALKAQVDVVDGLVPDVAP